MDFEKKKTGNLPFSNLPTLFVFKYLLLLALTLKRMGEREKYGSRAKIGDCLEVDLSGAGNRDNLGMTSGRKEIYLSTSYTSRDQKSGCMFACDTS